ncbi:hypothetical protein [Quadrisphaera sp. INWT6]|uniref:hypothetical protein n=1 Tax=Quadrisphaera sp. INWT6 TaxID=2596917 RepID=UPI0018922617|nr:hypothetical protein [Quadrisphaera sp. INWT6]MBF5083750.1 hypothetical protein [Quadrisphaera sp. INWT6]
MDERRLLTAHHEAGHAIAYLNLGYSFRYITLHPRTPGTTGFVAVHRPRSMLIADSAAITLSGPLAEEAFRSVDIGEAPEDAAWAAAFAVSSADAGSHREVDDGRDMLVRLGMPVELAVDGMANTLARDWAAVEALAQALVMSPRRLDYREAQMIVEASR